MQRERKDLSEDQQIAALLHDVIEDSQITVSTIRNLFGKNVCVLVDALTRYSKRSYEEYITRVSKYPGAIPIKLADLEDNLDESRGEVTPEIEGLRKRYIKAKSRLEEALKERQVE